MRQYLFPNYYPETYKTFKPEPGEMIGVHIGKSEAKPHRILILVLTSS